MRISWEALKTPGAQTTLRAIPAGSLEVDAGIRNFFLTPQGIPLSRYCWQSPLFLLYLSPWVVVREVSRKQAYPFKPAGRCFQEHTLVSGDRNLPCLCRSTQQRRPMDTWREIFELPTSIKWNITWQSKGASFSHMQQHRQISNAFR